jgi:Ca2+-binding RTX toxin-like protein
MPPDSGGPSELVLVQMSTPQPLPAQIVDTQEVVYDAGTVAGAVTPDDIAPAVPGIPMAVSQPPLWPAPDGSIQAPGDHVVGSGDDGVIFGSEGDDRIMAGAGNDVVFAGLGSDVVFGGEGNDQLSGGEGDDLVIGDAGDDIVLGEAGNDVVDGSDGHDVVAGGTGDDTVAGGAGDDLLSGGEGDDQLFDGAGSDTVMGDAGDDVIHVATDGEADVLNGGEGTDVLDLSDATLDITVDLRTGEVTSIEVGDDTISDFETVIGGSGDDVFLVGGQPMSLAGGEGDDTFSFSVPLEALAETPKLIHDILDFLVGDRILVADYEVTSVGHEDQEDRFQFYSGGQGEQPDELRLRISYETGADGEITLFQFDYDGNHDYELAVAVHGHIEPHVYEQLVV